MVSVRVVWTRAGVLLVLYGCWLHGGGSVYAAAVCIARGVRTMRLSGDCVGSRGLDTRWRALAFVRLLVHGDGSPYVCRRLHRTRRAHDASEW